MPGHSLSGHYIMLEIPGKPVHNFRIAFRNHLAIDGVPHPGRFTTLGGEGPGSGDGLGPSSTTDAMISLGFGNPKVGDM